MCVLTAQDVPSADGDSGLVLMYVDKSYGTLVEADVFIVLHGEQAKFLDSLGSRTNSKAGLMKKIAPTVGLLVKL